MGEIIKLNKDDLIPSLEIAVELENEKLNPNSHFVYLNDIQNDLSDINE